MGAVLRKTITKIIGKEKHNFQVESATGDLFDVIMEGQNLSFPDVHVCGLCGSDNLTLDAHLAQGKHKYVHITCRKCRGYINFGKQQENPNVYFLRLKKDEKGNTIKDSNGRTAFDWREFSMNKED